MEQQTCRAELEDDGFQVINVIYKPIASYEGSRPFSPLSPYVSSGSGVVIGEKVIYSEGS